MIYFLKWQYENLRQKTQGLVLAKVHVSIVNVLFNSSVKPMVG